MLSRRHFLKGLVTLSAGTAGFGGYAVAEPWRLGVARYAVNPWNWPEGLSLRLAVIADLHVCDPWMGLERVDQIVKRANAQGADAIVLLGDFVAGYRISRFSRRIPNEAWAEVLSGLKAPLGVHAVLGNHDWWDEPELQVTRKGPTKVRKALERAGIAVYENDVQRLSKNGRAFWLAGLGDQWAFWPRNVQPSGTFWRRRSIGYTGLDDLSGTLAKVTDDAPVILMAHEPDIFPEVPDRVTLTLSGHTHGGQVQVAGFAPAVPSRYGSRYRYGLVAENGRALIVSSGLGCSGLPVRFGVPPEIVTVTLGGKVTRTA